MRRLGRPTPSNLQPVTSPQSFTSDSEVVIDFEYSLKQELYAFTIAAVQALAIWFIFLFLRSDSTSIINDMWVGASFIVIYFYGRTIARFDSRSTIPTSSSTYTSQIHHLSKFTLDDVIVDFIFTIQILLQLLNNWTRSLVFIVLFAHIIVYRFRARLLNDSSRFAAQEPV